MKPLLLLVDLQCDFLNASDLEPRAEAVVQRAARLLRHCRGNGVPVAHVWTTVSRERDDRMPHWKQAGLWMCELGTPGHMPPAELAPAEGEAIIHKTGFGAFASPRLRALLATSGIDTVIIAGVKTHACVRQAALDAHELGLAVLIAEDAVASDDPVHAAITCRYLEARGMRFVNVDTLIRVIGGEPVNRLNDDTVTIVEATAARATERARSWRDTPVAVRATLLQRLAEVIHDRADKFAERMASEIGKPVRFGRVEALRSAEMLRAIAHRVVTSDAPHVAGERSDSSVTVRMQPHGVVAIITPWNNPIYISLGKIAPAVAYGNSVVWKPAPEASGVSNHLMECMLAAGWLDGLVSLLKGGRHVARALMEHASVDAVTITGSSAAGFAAQEVCARRRVPLQAELGGNNAAIIWHDADLRHAARAVAAGAFDMAGQRCTANRRAIVHQDCHARLAELLQAEAAALVWGDPRDPETRIGALVSDRHAERVAELVARAIADGAIPIWPHGDVHIHGASFHPPVMLLCDDPALEIVQEESFGPVLVVQTARNWEHAMNLCNGVRQGLAASVFTQSQVIIDRFLDQARAGILKINQSTADAAPDVAFGGWKASGLGPPEHGEFDERFYTRPQTIYADSTRHSVSFDVVTARAADSPAIAARD